MPRTAKPRHAEIDGVTYDLTGLPASVNVEPGPDRFVRAMKNESGETLVFVREGLKWPKLYHSDMDWQPATVHRSTAGAERHMERAELMVRGLAEGDEEAMRQGRAMLASGLADQFGTGLILEADETAWLAECVRADEQAKRR